MEYEKVGVISDLAPWRCAATMNLYKALLAVPGPDRFRMSIISLYASQVSGHVAEADFPWDTDGYRPATSEFIDGVTYDGRTPNAYLDSLAIGLKSGQRVSGADIVN